LTDVNEREELVSKSDTLCDKNMFKIETPYCSAAPETGSFVFCVYDVNV